MKFHYTNILSGLKDSGSELAIYFAIDILDLLAKNEPGEITRNFFKSFNIKETFFHNLKYINPQSEYFNKGLPLLTIIGTGTMMQDPLPYVIYCHNLKIDQISSIEFTIDKGMVIAIISVNDDDPALDILSCYNKNWVSA